MDGVHDLGGMHGFGPVPYEPDNEVFHEPWQATTFGLMLSVPYFTGNHNADEYRHGVERMAPSHYFSVHYYERVLTSVATLLVEKGKLSLDDLEQRAGGKFPLALPLAEKPMANLAPQTEQRFKAGDRVRVLEFHPQGHTRAPGFCRGKSGRVLHVAPPFSFPDASAHGGELRKEHTYHVEFASRELWGDDGQDNDAVVVDLWDSYLEGAGE